MKKTALLLSVLLGMPLLASAAPAVHHDAPGVHRQVGERDHRGYYWDGYDWRTPSWWQAHHGRNVGLKGPHGYWNGRGWQAQPPGGKKTPSRSQAHAQQNDRSPLPPHQNHS